MKTKIDFYKISFLLIFAFISYCYFKNSQNGRFMISTGSNGSEILDTRTGQQYSNVPKEYLITLKKVGFDSIHVGKPLLK